MSPYPVGGILQPTLKPDPRLMWETTRIPQRIGGETRNDGEKSGNGKRRGAGDDIERSGNFVVVVDIIIQTHEHYGSRRSLRSESTVEMAEKVDSEPGEVPKDPVTHNRKPREYDLICERACRV